MNHHNMVGLKTMKAKEERDQDTERDREREIFNVFLNMHT